MEIGIDSFAMNLPDPNTGKLLDAADRMEALLKEVETADDAGLSVFGVGEHHWEGALDSAPAIILAAAAARTKRIRLTSAVTVLSTADPVRVFQQFATLDLLSRGRAEIVAGRGSATDAFPLFGFQLDHYDALYEEKLKLLLLLRDETHITWRGHFRPSLSGQGVFPRPVQSQLPIWVGVGGTPQSFVRAGSLGLPLMIAMIGGRPEQFKPLVDLYRAAGEQADHTPEKLKVGVHAFGFVGESDQSARDAFFPGWSYVMGRRAQGRGGPQATRSLFDTMCEPSGAFFVGSAETVAHKLQALDASLGGVSRVTFQMSTAMLNAELMQSSIRMLGQVASTMRT